jgi:hypothetical protein
MTTLTAGITARTRRNNAYRSLAATYEQADRIIANRPLRVRLVDDPAKPPAWTTDNGAVITLNVALLGALDTPEDYVRVTGVNFHELAHVLFTPIPSADTQRLYSALSFVRGSFNVLEDQRIESMMVALAPSTADYYRAMFAQYVLEQPDRDALRYAWVLAHGRRYLGPEIIASLATVFAGSDINRTELAAIIDEYRQLDLTLRRDIERAVELAQQFDTIMRLIQGSPEDLDGQHGVDSHAGCDTQNRQQVRQSQAGVYGVRRGRDVQDTPAQQAPAKQVAQDDQDDAGDEDGEGVGEQQPGSPQQQPDDADQSDDSTQQQGDSADDDGEPNDDLPGGSPAPAENADEHAKDAEDPEDDVEEQPEDGDDGSNHGGERSASPQDSEPATDTEPDGETDTDDTEPETSDTDDIADPDGSDDADDTSGADDTSDADDAESEDGRDGAGDDPDGDPDNGAGDDESDDDLTDGAASTSGGDTGEDTDGAATG